MKPDVRNYYGFKQLPFSSDLKKEQLYKLQSMLDISDKIQFAVQNSMYFAIIGEVGAGKSTALRYASEQLPAKHFQSLYIVGVSCSFVELLRQCMASVGVYVRTNQQSSMLRTMYEAFAHIRDEGKSPVIFLDECHLYNSDVFTQLHLISQQSLEGGKIVPIVMCGQESLFDKLRSPFARPLHSRILDGYNVKSLSQDECFGYITHHLETIGGSRKDIFDPQALIAISQVSAGIPRRINATCLLALQHAMELELPSISADVIRQVSKNWWE